MLLLLLVVTVVGCLLFVGLCSFVVVRWQFVVGCLWYAVCWLLCDVCCVLLVDCCSLRRVVV